MVLCKLHPDIVVHQSKCCLVGLLKWEFKNWKQSEYHKRNQKSENCLQCCQTAEEKIKARNPASSCLRTAGSWLSCTRGLLVSHI